MARWAKIPDFPDYSVSDEGWVRNDDTGRILVITLNSHGVAQVGLMRHGQQYKRGVARLVATAHLDPSAIDTFDTPINLDGDRTNNNVYNLMWRPRWFAVKYHRQFRSDQHPAIPEPLQERKTGYRYTDSWDAATKHGLLDLEIMLAVMNRTYVWPTYQEFFISYQE